MNIKLSYLYRDGANYKNYKEVVFSNPDLISFDEINERIKKCLIDSNWFIADKWGLPNLFFEEYIWNNEIDHVWHEFEYLRECNHNITETISIKEFLIKIESQKNSSFSLFTPQI